jgi:hypothetical protein
MLEKDENVRNWAARVRGILEEGLSETAPEQLKPIELLYPESTLDNS